MSEKKYVTVDSIDTYKELCKHIEEHEIIAYDTETDSLNPRKGQIVGFSVSGKVGEGYYMPTMVYLDGSLQEVTISGKGCHELAKYAINKLIGKKLVMHNASFDTRFTKNFYKIDLISSLHADTALLVHTVKEEGAFGIGGAPFGLKNIAILVQKEIGLDVETAANEEQLELKASIKANGGSITKGNFEIYKADLRILSKYAAADADLTLRIFNHFLEVLKHEKLEDFFFNEEVMPLYKEVTVPMEEFGVKLDLKLIEDTRERIIEDLKIHKKLVTDTLLKDQKVRKWIIDRAVEMYPPKSKGTFAQELLEQENLNLPKSDKTGKFTINKASIRLVPEGSLRSFLETGDVDHLTKEQIVKVCLKLWKEQNDGEFFNIQSKDQLGEIAFNVIGIKPQSQTTKGKSQFDEDLIQSIGDEYEWAKYLRIYNKLTKIKSAYIDRFYEGHEDGRYYFYFKQNGTVSGRYGSDLQQLPKPKEDGEDDPIIVSYNNEVRAFLVCDESNSFIDTDYASLEPRVFAHVANDPGLKEIFNNDLDFYSHIAIQTEKLEGVSAHTKAPNFLKKVDPIKRQQAKSYSLGVPYGMSGYALAMTLGVSQKEGERLVEGYLDGFPELRKWRETSRAFVKEHGYIRNMVGRVRHLPIVKEVYSSMGDQLLDWKVRKDLERQYSREVIDKLYKGYKNGLNNVLNFQIQSLSASIVNRAALQINRSFKKEGITGLVIAQVHDQLVCEVLQKDVERAKPIIQYCMENTTTLTDIPLIAIPEVGKNMRDAH